MKLPHFTLLIMLLAACGQPISASRLVTPLPNTFTPMAGPTLIPTETAQAIEFNKDEASANVLAECLQAGGHIKPLKIASQYLDAGLTFRVYTPPCYEQETRRHYPVLYLVHGQTFNDDQWDRLGADEAASKLIASGEVSPFLIVMPYDISSNQPSLDHFGEAVIEELIPWIDNEYRTIPDRDHRAVGGLSRGASWAIHLGLTHPELFAAVGGHSPPVFVEDAPHVRKWLDTIRSEQMPRFWLDIGDRDQRVIMDSSTWFEGLLDQRNIVHEWSLFSGDHSEAYWRAHVEMYLRWYAENW